MKKRLAMIVTTLPLLFGLLVLGCPQDEGPDQPKPSTEVLDRIEIRSPPNNDLYPLGANAIDPTGLDVWAVYINEENNKERRVKVALNELIIDKPDLTVKGLKKVMVSWKDKTAFFEVWVGSPPKSVTLVTRPTNKYYAAGDEIDLTGAAVKAVYDDGDETVEGNDIRGRVKIMGKVDEKDGYIDSQMSVAGPKFLVLDYMGVEAAPIEHGLIVFGSEPLRALAADLAASTSGTTAATAITVKIPASVKAEDLEMQYTESVWDQIGGLYAALGAGRDYYVPSRPGEPTNDKYINLDLSEITWLGKDDDGKDIMIIPGSTLTAYEWRFERTSRDRIRSLKLPADVVEIRSQAFRALTGLSKIDLNGLSKLVLIGEAAFRGSGPTGSTAPNLEIDFTGCVSLKNISLSAFNSTRVQLLDLTPCTSLSHIYDYAFAGCGQLQFVELPPSIYSFQDYAFDGVKSLKYVRFRTPAPAVVISWRNFAAVAVRNNPPVHPLWSYFGSSEAWVDASMNNYVIFYPRSFTWTIDWGGGVGGIFESNQCDTLWAHIVSLPYSNNPDKVYDDPLDGLRGQALLDYNDGLRGQSSITIDASKVQDEFKSGHTIKIANWKESEPLTGSITLDTPPAGALTEATPENVKKIVGYQAWGNYYNYPGWEERGKSTWKTSRGNEGALGVPVIWPDNIASNNPSVGYPKFLLLEIEVYNSTGKQVGYLDRWGRCSYTMNIEDRAVEEVRVARWLYVDKNCTIFNYAAFRGKFLWLELKKGWNLIEVVEPYFWKKSNEEATMTVEGRHNLSIGTMFLRISPGLIGSNDTLGGRPDIHGPNGQKYLPLVLPSVELPWVVRSTNTWRQLTDRPMPTDISKEPPDLVPDVNVDARPGDPVGARREEGQFGYQEWWTLSRKHPWRAVE